MLKFSIYSGEMCLNKITLKFFYALGNLMNMDKESLAECTKLFDQTKGYDYQTIYEQCNHPVWKTTNLWIPLRQRLSDVKQTYSQIINKLQEKNNNQPRKTLQLFIQYYSQRVSIIDEVLEDSLKLEQESKTSNGGKLPKGTKLFKDEL